MVTEFNVGKKAFENGEVWLYIEDDMGRQTGILKITDKKTATALIDDLAAMENPHIVIENSEKEVVEIGQTLDDEKPESCDDLTTGDSENDSTGEANGSGDSGDAGNSDAGDSSGDSGDSDAGDSDGGDSGNGNE